MQGLSHELKQDQSLIDSIVSWPHQIIGSFGTRILLPPDVAEHAKSDPRFSADEVVKKSMASTLPGFECLRATDALTTMIRTKLSTNLGRFQPCCPLLCFTSVMTLTIPTQQANSLRNWRRRRKSHLTCDGGQALVSYLLPSDSFLCSWLNSRVEWHEVELLASLRDVVTQVSTRIFLGPELCRDEEWLDNIQAYTNSVFHAVRVIRSWPEWSRPCVQWFLKDCRKIRQQVKRAEEMIEPIIAKRIGTTERAKKGLADMPNDAMTWMHQTAMSRNEKYHGAHAQLSLSMASVRLCRYCDDGWAHG